MDTFFILQCNTNKHVYMVCETFSGALHSVLVNIHDLLLSVVIGEVDLV